MSEVVIRIFDRADGKGYGMEIKNNPPVPEGGKPTTVQRVGQDIVERWSNVCAALKAIEAKTARHCKHDCAPVRVLAALTGNRPQGVE